MTRTTTTRLVAAEFEFDPDLTPAGTTDAIKRLIEALNAVALADDAITAWTIDEEGAVA